MECSVIAAHRAFSDRVEVGWTGHKQAVDEDAAMLALTFLVEGNSIRGVSRVTGLGKKTVMSMPLIAGAKCEALMSEHQRRSG